MFFDFTTLLTLPVNRAAYSDRTAYVMAECSRLAYCKFENGGEEEEHFKSDLQKGGFQLVKTFNKEGTQAFLATGKTFAVLAFRGTEKNRRDILDDLKVRFYKDEKSGQKIQRGFKQAYDRVAQAVAQATQGLNLPIFITGHSLGGALATIASMEIPAEKVAACYTFGSPRVGNAEFARELYKVPVYRIVHAADIVPRVPLMGWGYRHAGDLRYITRAGDVLRSPAQLLRLLWFILLVLGNWHSLFLDHRMAEYSAKLAKWAQGRQTKPLLKEMA